MRKKVSKTSKSYRRTYSIWLLFLFFLMGVVFVSCKRESTESADLPAWKLDGSPPEIAKRVRDKNILEDILFYNDFFQKFDTLKTDKSIEIQKYVNNLKTLEIVKGTKKERKKYIELEGQEIIFTIDPESELVNIQAENLNLVEMEMDCDRDAEIKIYMVPLGNSRKIENGWYGSFISQKFFPEEKGRKFRNVIFDLSQRFGWEKKYFDRLNVKITPAEGNVISVRLKSIAMLSHKTKLYERIPSKSYHRYGGSARKRLESIFLPAGTEIAYTLETPEIEPFFIDGHLGSVDGQDIRFEINLNGRSLLNKEVTRDLSHFSERVDPEKKRNRLTVKVQGESGRIGIIGNMSVFRPPQNKKNVVFYLVDALRADKGGIQEDLFENEFLDGAIFTKAYSNATRTADSLPSLFSGRYKFTLVEKDIEVPFVSSKELMLAEYLKTRGYITAAFINNPWLDLSNATQGFDHIYFCWSPIKERTITPSLKDYHNNKYGEMKSLIDAFIQENENKQVFIYIHTMEPHVPYELPTEVQKYSKDVSREIKEQIFKNFSKSPPYPNLTDPSDVVIEALKNQYKDAVEASYEFYREMDRFLYDKNVLNEDSLMILSSDHGERFYEHRSWIHGPPDVYNEVLRVPLMMKGKGVQPGIYARNVQLLDIYPTIVDWLGGGIDGRFPGISLFDFMNVDNENLESRIIYADGTKNNHFAFIRDTLKVVIQGKNIEVFDLTMDPQEKMNLSEKPEYEDLISEAMSFREQFERLFGKESKSLSAEEIERLKSLGYIK